jgi:hypothetical protein
MNENRMIDIIDDPGKGPDRGRLRTRPVGLSGLSSEQVKALSGRELELARRKGTEKVYVIAKNGCVVVEREGTEDRIIFDDDELAQMANCVLTHNHPSGRSFSLADLQLAVQYQLVEIRSVTRRYVFRARPSEDGWPAWETVVYPRIAEALRQATQQMLAEAERYHLDAIQSDQTRQHVFMWVLSKLCGFRYHREGE